MRAASARAARTNRAAKQRRGWPGERSRHRTRPPRRRSHSNYPEEGRPAIAVQVYAHAACLLPATDATARIDLLGCPVDALTMDADRRARRGRDRAARDDPARGDQRREGRALPARRGPARRGRRVRARDRGRPGGRLGVAHPRAAAPGARRRHRPHGRAPRRRPRAAGTRLPARRARGGARAGRGERSFGATRASGSSGATTATSGAEGRRTSWTRSRRRAGHPLRRARDACEGALPRAQPRAPRGAVRDGRRRLVRRARRRAAPRARAGCARPGSSGSTGSCRTRAAGRRYVVGNSKFVPLVLREFLTNGSKPRGSA